MADNIVVEEGKVLSIASSDTKNGKFYRIEVEDLETGDVDWFGLGNTEPDFGEDSIVTFEFFESGKYLNIEEDTLEVLDLVEPKRRGRGTGSRGSNGSKARGTGRGRGGRSDDDKDDKPRGRGGRSSGSGRGGSKPAGRSGAGSKSGSKGTKGKDSGGTDWEAKDKRTALGFAREQAMKLTAAMLADGAIKLPTKAGEKMDAYLEYVDMFTARFLEQADAYLEEGIEAIYADADDE